MVQSNKSKTTTTQNGALKMTTESEKSDTLSIEYSNYKLCKSKRTIALNYTNALYIWKWKLFTVGKPLTARC